MIRCSGARHSSSDFWDFAAKKYWFFRYIESRTLLFWRPHQSPWIVKFSLKNITPPIGKFFFCRSFYSDSYTFLHFLSPCFFFKNRKLVLRQDIFAINPSQLVNYSNFTKSCWVQLESQQLIPSFMDRLVQRGHVQKLLKRTSALVEFQVFSNRT